MRSKCVLNKNKPRKFIPLSLPNLHTQTTEIIPKPTTEPQTTTKIHTLQFSETHARPKIHTLQFYQATNPPAKPTQQPPKPTQPPSNPTWPTHQIQPTHSEPRPPMVSHDHPTHDKPQPPHPRQATTTHEQTPDHGDLNPTYLKLPC